MTDREDDYIKRFETMNQIDALLNYDAELMVTVFLGGEEKAHRAFSIFGKKSVVEFSSIWLWTKLAKDRLAYYELGLLTTKEKGDLRNARLASESGQFEAMMKFRRGRDHPEMKAHCSREVFKMNASFHRQMARILDAPPVEFDQLNTPPLRGFLLLFWAEEHLTRNGVKLPPLCYCSDPVIVQLADFLGGLKNVTTETVKKLANA